MRLRAVQFTPKLVLHSFLVLYRRRGRFNIYVYVCVLTVLRKHRKKERNMKDFISFKLTFITEMVRGIAKIQNQLREI